MINVVIIMRPLICMALAVWVLFAGLAFAQPCEKPVAKVVSVQGEVEIQRKGETAWKPVKLNETCCLGDMIQVHKLGRADLLLTNDTVMRLDQLTHVTFAEPEEEGPFWVRLLRGASYFFSRVRRGMRVLTPYVNASVEGTEFLVRVEDNQTLITLFEGKVAATNPSGSLTLEKGQTMVAEAGRSPVLKTVVRPRDAVQWTLYYPPTLYFRESDLSAGTPSGWQGLAVKSFDAFTKGNLREAISVIEGTGEDVRDSRFFTYRASLWLSVGRVEEAEADIARSLSLSPEDSQALALKAVIAVVRNEKDEALELAKKAVEADPKSAAGRIALSYALQARFDLRGALESLEQAVDSEPDNALAWARLAELRLSFGEMKQALQAAQKAAEISPDLSRTQSVLGFANLTRVETKKARVAFEKAIELDQADPLPRLGLGLAKIREGDLTDGRAEIEISASLDPESSLIRSYLGKAYYEEKRDKPASTQFGMAKELDPKDPTPYFYDAIRKQTINRPVEALYDLQESIRLNDNRAVYRSRLLLDSDLAARSASLGRIYSDLGFQQQALVEGWKSVNADPANFSAHRFLADSYAALPRHEIARVSELLQSQLLQPININPVQTRLAESNPLFVSGVGPLTPSFNEYSSLFNRNRLALQASGIVGGQDTWGEEVLQSGVWNKLSYSLGQSHFQTDGFRENNDLSRDIYNVFVQGMLSENTSLQSEFRAVNTDNGDRTLNFLPWDFQRNQRERVETRSVRLGFRQTFWPGSDLIGNFVYQSLDSDTKDPSFAFDIQQNFNNYSAELQYLLRLEGFSVVAGGGFFNVRGKNDISIKVTIPDYGTIRSFTTEERNVKHTTIYLYSQVNYPKNVTLTLGASGDFFSGGIVDRNQFNPKVGLTWTPFTGTTLRAAAFRTLRKSLINDQTLESTQVAGFNQFFDDLEVTESWNYGVAADQKLLNNLSIGAELSKRDLDVPYEALVPVHEIKQANWDEWLGRAYLYWTPHPWFALSAEYFYEKMDRGWDYTYGFEHVETHRVPLGVGFFHPSGISARVTASYIDQSGTFQPQTTGVLTFIPGSDRFWVVDASLSYRLPKRFGIIGVGVKNLFDKSFHFQDTDPVNPRMQPRRFVFGTMTLTF